MQNYSVQPEALKKFTTAIFEAAGLKNNEAASIAELLVHADLRNVHSHGVLRTIPYLEKIQGGGASKTSKKPPTPQSLMLREDSEHLLGKKQ